MTGSTDADRDVLFGLLALQTDFVERTALIDAMSTWLPARTRPLAEELVASGALSAEDRTLLEPLVEAHVRRPGDWPPRATPRRPSDREHPGRG